MATLLQRRIILTGASSGIGWALADALAREKADLVLAARSGDRLSELRTRLTSYGGKIIVVGCDVSVAEQRVQLVQTAIAELGGLDILINNAGIASWGHFADSDESVMRHVMEVNFFAPTELIRLTIPYLAKGVEPLIVNVSSMCGRRGMPAWPEYSASKFAMCGLTESLRGEMARFDIDMVLVVPGLARTGLRDHMLRNEGKARIDFEAGMPPEQVAAKIVKAMKRRKTEVVIGSDAKWMLRADRFFPKLVNWLICRRVKKLYDKRI